MLSGSSRFTSCARRVAWIAFLICCSSAVGAAAEEIEIFASRFGYNLLRPTSRCCAFDLHIAVDGAARLTVKRSGGERPATESQTFKLSSEQLRTINKLVDDNAFFSLPKEICCGSVDGDEHQIFIRIGNRSHRVHFGEVSSDKQQADFARALNVWRGLKATFKIAGENVEQ
jgi:hypothetical protein